MTLEDKIIALLKDKGLALLCEDPEALRSLAERAIKEAIFSPRITGNSYNERKEPSLVVEAASERAKKMVADLVDGLVAKMVKEPTVMASVIEAIVAALPGAVLNSVRTLHEDAVARATMIAQTDLRGALERARIHS